jgi:hypothetical protein
MEMVRTMKYVCLIALSVSAFGADFMLAIGNPAAASIPLTKSTPGGGPVPTKVSKDALFAVRSEGCADPAKVRITGTAEGLVDGLRQSSALRVLPGSIPGVYIVSREGPPQGVWVVRMAGVCEGAKAGALVPVVQGGFQRESAKFYPRSITDAELEAALRTLSGGPK